MTSLLEKYRPQTLADVLGQPAVTRALTDFVVAPYSTGMLFHGDSGVGKSATAMALACDLGCRPDQGAFGGYTELASGEQTADAVRRELANLRHAPMFGSQWRVLVLNEADRMLLPAETLWLDALERLPDRTLVIFTTNMPEKLSKRFRDRCEQYHFTSETKRLKPHLRKLAEKVWAAEVGKGKAPGLDWLGLPRLGAADTLNASFRLALQQLTKLIREYKQRGAKGLKAVEQQLALDTVDDAHAHAACDHCGEMNDMPSTVTEWRCVACGKTFNVE